MEITASKKRQKQSIRANRTRARIRTHINTPRLSVFRSGKHIYAQIIDDRAGRTLVSAHDIVSTKVKKEIKTPLGAAVSVGTAIAEQALEKKIKKVAFDRGGYKYHGRIKALAEAARKAGLEF